MSLRLTAERKSKAPRYLGVTEFAKTADVAPADLSDWRRTGTVWVPKPAVVLGTRRRPGWERECAESWTPGAMPIERPEPAVYWDAAAMQRHYKIGWEVLWKCIVDDESMEMPDLWVDDRAGWFPQSPKSPK